jgi:probable rRNA maturation factor
MNKPTDVLSFPALPDDANRGQGGDLAISLETASAQAAEHGHTLQIEVKVLILHGLLHLAGYDHERDQGRMRRRENLLRRQFALPAGLVERTLGARSPVTRSRPVVPSRRAAFKSPGASRSRKP